MADRSADPEFYTYLVCVLYSERDPDMEGFAVRLSAFLINVCLAISIKWADDSIQDSVNSVLITTFSLLICTFVTLIRKQLSVADAHFAITITVSPLALYIVYASIRDIFNKRTYLFRSVKSRRVVKAFSLFLLLSWLGLEVLLYTAGDNIFAGKGCDKITFMQFIRYRAELSVHTATIPIWLSMALLPIPFSVYTIRHLKDIWDLYEIREDGARRWGVFEPLRSAVQFIPRLLLCQWIVITRSHPWVFFYISTLVYTIWGTTLLIWVRDLQHYYRTLAHKLFPQLPEPPNHHTYNLWGFGQLLAATCAIPPVYEIFKLLFIRRSDVLDYFRQLPKSLWDGLVFLLTGHRNPWHEIRYTELKFTDVERNGRGRLVESPEPLSPEPISPVSERLFASSRRHYRSYGAVDDDDEGGSVTPTARRPLSEPWRK